MGNEPEKCRHYARHDLEMSESAKMIGYEEGKWKCLENEK